MIVAILREIHFVIDEEKHSVAYAKRAMGCVGVPRNPSSHWKAVIGKDEEDVQDKLRAQVVSFLQRMNLDPADFEFSYRHTDVDEFGQFWLLGDDGGSFSGRHSISGKLA
jgi:hypothetical protein